MFPRGAADSVHNAAFPGAVAEFAGDAGSVRGADLSHSACSAKGSGAAWLGLGGAGPLWEFGRITQWYHFASVALQRDI